MAQEWHKILKRQIERTLGKDYNFPPEIRALLDLVSKTYDHFDEDRALVERSLEISSQELSEKNAALQKELQEIKHNEDYINELEIAKKNLEKMNRFMIGREIRMAELKKELKERGNEREA